MSGSFEQRLTAAEKAYAAKHDTGPKLTGGLTAYFWCDDPPEKIAEARATPGMRVIAFDVPRDEAGPKDPIW